MEITVKDFMDQIETGSYEQVSTETDLTTLAKDGLPNFTKTLFDATKDALKQNKMINAQLMIKTDGEPIVIQIQSGIINLPYENVKKVNQFFESEDEKVPVKLYLLVQAQDLNVSHFRIDQITTAADYLKDATEANDQIDDSIHQKLALIEANEKERLAEEAKPKPVAKKSTTRKTTAKKAPAKRRTTTKRKTTTRRKTTTKRKTTAKKTK